MDTQGVAVIEERATHGSLLYRVWRTIASGFLPSERSLLSPVADVLFAGGASLVAFVIIYFFIDKTTSIGSWAWIAYYLAFLVNYPHFAASYQIMYGDARKGFTDVRNNKKFALKLWWAGVLVPLVLIGYFLYALGEGSVGLMGYMQNALFFFVGWHYIKQIYGCVIVLSSAKKVYYTKIERWSVLFPLYGLWALSFITANLYGSTYQSFQVPYTMMQWSEFYQHVAYTILAVGTLVMLAVFWWKFHRDRVLPPFSALVAVVAIYVWYIPALSHPFYFYIIPFFHSLQYLLFVFAYRRNSAAVESAHGDGALVTRAARRLTATTIALIVTIPFVIAGIVWWQHSAIALETWIGQKFAIFTLVSLIEWGEAALLVTLVAGILIALAFYARKNAYGAFGAFFANAIVVGALMFSIIPISLDLLARNHVLPSILSYNGAIFGPALYLFFVTVFVNIHHYFIDNVIWKSDDPYVRQYLLYRTTKSGT